MFGMVILPFHGRIASTLDLPDSVKQTVGDSSKVSRASGFFMWVSAHFMDERFEYRSPLILSSPWHQEYPPAIWVQPLLGPSSKTGEKTLEPTTSPRRFIGVHLGAHRIGVDVKNPWTKKNPFMSMWLSGANKVVGSARGRASAAAKKQVVDFWTTALTPPKPKKRRTRR
jgi:hypothetical protein